MYKIYKHTLPDGTFYIGQTKERRLERRWQGGVGYKNNREFFKAILEYGWKNIKHEVIEEVSDKKLANKREGYWIQYWIAQGFNTFNTYKVK